MRRNLCQRYKLAREWVDVLYLGAVLLASKFFVRLFCHTALLVTAVDFPLTQSRQA